MMPRAYKSYDANAVSEATGIVTGDESFVQQHLAEEVDINTIVLRFGLTGSLPGSPQAALYGDFTGIYDYESALEKVQAARDAFMTLPADLRDRFENDPGKFMRYAELLDDSELDGMLPVDEGGSEPPGVAPEPSE